MIWRIMHRGGVGCDPFVIGWSIGAFGWRVSIWTRQFADAIGLKRRIMVTRE